jgi:hypothetical protein
LPSCEPVEEAVGLVLELDLDGFGPLDDGVLLEEGIVLVSVIVCGPLLAGPLEFVAGHVVGVTCGPGAVL